MSYQLKLNGKIWKTINGKTIRNLIYNGIIYEITKPVEAKGYLTFSSDKAFWITITTNAVYDGSLEYSTDITTWTEVTKGTMIASVDNNIYFRGSNNTYCKASVTKSVFSFTGSNIRCEGNIETLLDYQTVMDGEHPIMADHCYEYMFENNASLITAPELPATTLTDYCYAYMFSNCRNLIQAPDLPARVLAYNCYRSMFSSCSNLITIPAILPATALAEYCYCSMFSDCTSLTRTPELPATTLASSCYSYMFKGCTSLTQVSDILPATTLAERCYNWMFSGCSSLTRAPELPATTLTDYCYDNMFSSCTSLTQAPKLPATTATKGCYHGMFEECKNLITAPALPATTLTHYCYPNMFKGCTNLTTLPALPATTLLNQCYEYMFTSCKSIKLSTTPTNEYTTEYRIPSGTATGTVTGSPAMAMFSATGGTFQGTPSINTTYYTSNELVYGLTIQVDDSEKDYIQILSDIPTSITTNQTIRLRVRTTSNSISYSSTEQTDITKEWICKADDGSYHEYDLIISNPTGFETIQIRHSSVPSPTPF